MSVDDILYYIGKPIPKKTNKSTWNKIISKYVDGLGSRSSSRLRTWKRPNKRYDCLPGYKTKRYRDISVFVDISGSMSIAMKKAVENIATISQFNNGISNLILWNTKLVKEYKHVGKNKVTEILQYCGGGTSLVEGIKYIDATVPKDEVIVIVSDLQEISYESLIIAINNLAKKRTLIVGYPKDDSTTSSIVQTLKTEKIAI